MTRTAAFDYALLPALIAQEPITPRDSSRLLVVHRRSAARRFEHRRFTDIGDYLQAGDLLVANDTRVIPGRLWAQRPGGDGVELLLLRPMREGWWEALARPARRLRAGTILTLIGPPGHASGPHGAGAVDEHGPATSPDKQPDPRIEVGERTANGGVQVRPLASLSAVLTHYGQVPLPPYIQRPLTDAERYQTIYGQHEGSAAAPTAGLHFTPQLLDLLRAKQVRLAFVTLHIGLDTFRPIRTETIERHRMHAEYVTLNEETAAAISATRAAGRRVIAVGTTAVRTLEAAALAAAGGPPLATSPQAASTLAAAAPAPAPAPGGAEHGSPPGLPATSGWTALYITPGHQFRVVDALITNFHLPRSTLLVLVAAFADRSLLFNAYQEALRLRYRFFSFGDAMLIV